MLRSQTARLGTSALRLGARTSTRSFVVVTPPPPSGQPAPNPNAKPSMDSRLLPKNPSDVHYSQNSNPKPSDNTALWVATAVAAAGGLYYFYREGADTEEKARRADEDAKAHAKHVGEEARRAGDATKARAEGVLREGKERYDDAKASTRQTAEDAKAGISQRTRDARETLDSYGRSAEQSLADARNAAERKAQEAKQRAEESLTNARNKVEGASEEVKDTWWSWLGWGKAKGREMEGDAKGIGRDIERKAREYEGSAKGVGRDIEREGKELKRAGSEKVAESAEDVRKRAERRAKD